MTLAANLAALARRVIGTAANNLLALDGAGKLPAVDGSQLTGLPAPLVRGATIATTSGTAIDFVGIPSTARKITLALKGVTTSASSAQIILQLGAGAVVATGYAGVMMHAGGANSSGGIYTVTTGFAVAWEDAAQAATGICTLINRTGNEWVLSSLLAENGKAYVACAGGSKDMAGVLDRIRITTTGGTNTFTAGSITIFWE